MNLPIVIFQAAQSRNEYLEKLYFASLRSYFATNSISVSNISDFDTLDALKSCTILINGDHLNPERTLRLKNSNNTLVSFDINDNTLLSDAYRAAPELDLVDLIFKIGGIQKQNQSQDLSIDEVFNFSLRLRQFLPDDLWPLYKKLSDDGRLQSLPYVPWQHHEASQHSYSQRSGKVLIRGGNHFYRYMVFLNLLKAGKLDERSSFATADYFREDMVEQFRNCENCCAERRNLKRSKFDGFSHMSAKQCTSPAQWGGELTGLETYETANRWNNRCPQSFFWLTQQFEKRHGRVDHHMVEKALNGVYQSGESFTSDLAQATFYSDLKWLFSIYCPPRFWEAANAGTINFLPRRTNEQSYFPHVEEGVHYLTFLEDFSDFNPEVDEKHFEEISAECNALYEGYIKPGSWPISERLCRYIVSLIQETLS